jgi:aspartate beta-hydroxylase
VWNLNRRSALRARGCAASAKLCAALCWQGLRAQPWWDPREFPWTAVLEANADVIRNELASVQLVSVCGRSEHDGSLVSRGTWSEVVLLSGPGVLHRENCARCPRTAALLLQISAATSLARCGVGEALFSALAPGTRLRPHCGSSNARLTGEVARPKARCSVHPEAGH